MPLSDKLMLLILTAAFAFGPFLNGAVLAQVKSPVDPSFPIEAQDPQFAPDRVIVKYRAGAADVVGIISPPDGGIGVELIRTLPLIDANLYRVPPGWTVEQTVEWYRGQAGVEYAEPDYTVFPIEAIPYVTTPNDPKFSELWGLNNTGQTGGIADADIDAPEAWDVTTGDSTIIVGIIDTGIDISHPDLVDNIWVNTGEIAGNGIDDDGNGFIDDVNGWDFYHDDNSVYDPADGDSHATHVAGTIGGLASNSVGVTGIAWNVKLMPLKFLGAGGGSISDAVDALNYAVANGAKFTTNSWGGGGYSQAMYDAIELAGNRGQLFNAAAGNSGLDSDVFPHYPAGYDLDNVISIAATDHSDLMASFSTYGLTTVDLGAPGVAIVSTTPGDTYSSYSGTSMATPHVSGVTVLVYARWPDATTTWVKNRLMVSGNPLGALDGKTVSGKRLNANNVLDDDSIAPSPVTNLAVAADAASSVTPLGGTSLRLTWTASGDDGLTGTATSYDIRYALTAITDDATFNAAMQVKAEPAPASTGSSESYTVPGLNPESTYHFALKIADNVGNTSTLSNGTSAATGAVYQSFSDNAETTASDSLWTADSPWGRTAASASPDGGEGKLGGFFSWTDSPDGNYGNNVNTSITSDPISLASTNKNTLAFDYKHDLETNYDYGYVEASKNAGATWDSLATYNGTQAGWTSASIDFSAYDGEAAVQIRFRLQTDGSVVRDGWYVDDVRIVSDIDAKMNMSVSINATNDTALVTIDLTNDRAIAGVTYAFKWDDSGDILSHDSTNITTRSTGFTHNVNVDAANDSLSATMVETGGSLIASGSGAITEHRFVVRDDLTAAGSGSAVSEPAAGGPTAGLPTVFFKVPFSFNSLTTSDSLGNPLWLGGRIGGDIKIDLVSGDVDLDGTVELTDVVSTLDHTIGRDTLSGLPLLVADTYLDQVINVVDVVRGINIILGRQIGTTGSAAGAPVLVTGRQEPLSPTSTGKNLDVTLRPNVRAAGTGAANVTDLVADIPPDVVGLQISIEYDPSRGRISKARLLLDGDEFRMVENIGPNSANFLIYSPSNTPLPENTLALIGLEFESEGPSSLGSSASRFQLTQVLGVDAAGTPVYPGIKPMLAVQELLGSPLLDTAQKLQLDRRGNRDGVYNLGDLLALLHRSGLLPEDAGPDAWRTPLQGPRR